MAPRPATPMTQSVADEIRRLKRAEGLYNHEIAARLNINQGRVSEVLTGKRFPEIKPHQRDLFD
jgi:transcriptional regulator with XRE-family HTH domain